MSSTQTWIPERYASNARYASSFADFTLPVLAPQHGEKILDLGCGDGRVTMQLIAAGANVIGIDPVADTSEAFRCGAEGPQRRNRTQLLLQTRVQ
jgi:predicted RNA methylase